MEELTKQREGERVQEIIHRLCLSERERERLRRPLHRKSEARTCACGSVYLRKEAVAKGFLTVE